MDHRPFIALLLTVALLAGCATPRVAIYPDDHYKRLPKETVQRDIDDCEAKANESVKSHKGQIVAQHVGVGAFFGAFLGVIVGAFTGNYARAISEGAAMGAATGLVGGAIKANSPDGVHRKFVEYCLMEKGYKPMGWR
jgi:uncharacterized membrane protein